MSTHITAPELAPESGWYKSSYSGDTGNSCIELARQTTRPGTVAVRDSKDKTGPALVLTPVAWASFVSAVRNGEFGTSASA